MQERSEWHPPVGALGRLTQAAYERVERLEAFRLLWESQAREPRTGGRFAEALRAGDHVAVIAEVKRRSPSKGVLNESIDAVERSREYERAGASALSILTEPVEFMGSVEDLLDVSRALKIPLLKKDFHVAPIQLLEARVHGASAALLIARALPPNQLRDLVHEALSLGLDPLVEIRTEQELAVALSTPAALIGVNARDLESLAIDSAVTARLLPLIPPDRVAIAESGIQARADVARAAALGARAVLVGSALSLAHPPTTLLRELASVPR